MYAYDTVTAAVKGLKERGYTLDFNLKENCLVCDEDKFDINDFEIVEVYRFEGDSDPGDEAVVYAIESNKGHKGVLVNGYGISSNALSAEMAKKMRMHLR
ncbi:MAG: phosphoribosylpyrophosphate synthetase [Bacteroidota bacterium]|nr:phosphoribosylpyrophosphate synthetase [Bacteroidota bacterium]